MPEKSSETSELGEHGLVRDGKNPDASVLEDAGLGARSNISVGAWVDGVEGAHLWSEGEELRHVRAEGVPVAPDTSTLLRRDRVAVAVVYDDVPKRLVYA